jgi:hypothetical protein
MPISFEELADMADLNTSAAIRNSLEQVWGQLADAITEAKLLERRAEKDPELRRDPVARDHMRWLSLFERELGAVQKVYDAASAGVNIPEEQMLVADEAGRELLRILSARTGAVERDGSTPAQPRQPALSSEA